MGSSTYYNFRYNCIVTRLKSDTVCSIAYRQSLRPLGSADSAKVFVAEEKPYMIRMSIMVATDILE